MADSVEEITERWEQRLRRELPAARGQSHPDLINTLPRYHRADEIIGKHFSVLYRPEDAAGGRPTRNLRIARIKGRREDEWWPAAQGRLLVLGQRHHHGPLRRRGVLEPLGLESYMCVPLVTGGRIRGVITFASADPGRRYTEEDLRFAEEVGRRPALNGAGCTFRFTVPSAAKAESQAA
ncbi:MAG: GAF domain-containing protein [Byssovorax sp.]